MYIPPYSFPCGGCGLRNFKFLYMEVVDDQGMPIELIDIRYAYECQTYGCEGGPITGKITGRRRYRIVTYKLPLPDEVFKKLFLRGDEK